MNEKRLKRVCIVGSSTRFLSGISYYTIRLANTLTDSYHVSVILMRQLLPSRFYPGRRRIGEKITQQEYLPSIQVFDGVDWYWIPSIFKAIIFLWRERPDFIVFQWWSGTVFHSYCALALVARFLGAKAVIEFHEVLDIGESNIILARMYVRLIAPILINLAHGFVAHSEFDRNLLRGQYNLGKRPIACIPHGPYDHYKLDSEHSILRFAPRTCCNLLFFGVIRPFKGLEDLVKAFDSIPEDEINNFWLTIVGEPWEGWTVPFRLIARSRYRNRITVVDRYVPDEEVAGFFAGADAVVLPYHRSLSSGPLQIAMSWGLPVIITNVGGIQEAVSDYAGAIMIPPRDPTAIRNAIRQVIDLLGKHFDNPNKWEYVARFYNELLVKLGNDLIIIEKNT
jgi:glycosyltransferase involved in cell wall biosynthesis